MLDYLPTAPLTAAQATDPCATTPHALPSSAVTNWTAASLDWDDQSEPVPHGVLPAEAEQLLGRPVPGRDLRAVVQRHDRVAGGSLPPGRRVRGQGSFLSSCESVGGLPGLSRDCWSLYGGRRWFRREQTGVSTRGEERRVAWYPGGGWLPPGAWTRAGCQDAPPLADTKNCWRAMPSPGCPPVVTIVLPKPTMRLIVWKTPRSCCPG